MTAARRLSPAATEWLCVLAVGVAGVLVAVWTFDLFALNPRVPMTTGGDGNLVLGQVRNLDRGWWYLHSDLLATPFGQDLRDYPLPGDALNLLVIKAIGVFTDDVGLIVNFFYLATYPAIAVAGYLGCRLLGLRRPVSMVAGVVYTALPYHLVRGIPHMFLANYAVVPLVLALVLRQAGPRPLLCRRRGAGWRGWRHRDAAIGWAVVVMAGTSGFYYAVFSVLFLTAAGALAALRRGRRGLLAPAAAVGAIGLLLFVQLLPSVLHQLSAGRNQIVVRGVEDFDNYPLRPSMLFLPMNGHRAEPIREWRASIPPPSIPSEGLTEPLGIFGTAGLFASLVLVVAAGRRRTRWARRVADAPILVVLAILLASYSGFDTLFGLAGFTQIRAWNRISVWIAFLCIAVAAAGLQHLLRTRPRTAALLLPLVCVGAVWDQTPVWSAPDHRALAAAWESDTAFVRQVEAVLGPGAAVFQLPLAPYPEVGPIAGMSDYAQMYGYLHSDTLRWSYGGVKGRLAGDWILRLDPASPGFVDDLVVTGFSGLAVNLDGYADRGAAVDAVLRGTGLVPLFDSHDGRLRLYDLRPAARTIAERLDAGGQARRRAELLEQPEVRFGAGWYHQENLGGPPFRWSDGTAVVSLRRDLPAGAYAVKLRLGTYSPGSWPLTVRVGDQVHIATVTGEVSDVVVPIGTGGAVELVLSVDAPGFAAPDGRTLVFALHGLPTVVAAQSSP